MNKSMVARLAALEVFGGAVEVHLTEVRFVGGDGDASEPSAYSNGCGERWVRQPDESQSAFFCRAAAGARAAAPPNCCAVLLEDNDGDLGGAA